MTSSSPNIAFDANGDGTYGDNSKTLINGALTITARDNTAATGVSITAIGGGASGTSPSYTIGAGPLDHYDVVSASYSQTAGISFTVTVTAHDQFHNLINDSTTSVTMTSSSTTMLFDANGNGTFGEPGDKVKLLSAGTFTITVGDTAAATGVTMTAIGGGESGTSLSYNISPGALDHIGISPTTSTITAGDSLTYTAQSFDAFNNPIADVTGSAVFSIDTGAGGSWATNVYTSAKAGTWTVTGTCLGLTDTASLTVNPGALDHIGISPAASTITAGDSQTFTAQSYDRFGNFIADVPETMMLWFIESSAGGSWAANVYTSEKAGVWTVTGGYSGPACATMQKAKANLAPVTLHSV
jgi:hypothetical protein